ncbi:MAG: hypothetical protein VYC02_02910 [SAR324 cluster bacterium]|nr:hypothetical protein [SAR324 cluster bacterium]MEE2598977.1 hypothetical protein [SAR324 cluster bacterium]
MHLTKEHPLFPLKIIFGGIGRFYKFSWLQQCKLKAGLKEFPRLTLKT